MTDGNPTVAAPEEASAPASSAAPATASVAAAAHDDAYQLDARGHRGSAAVRRLVEYAPATGALALWMRHRDVDEMPPARGAAARTGLYGTRARPPLIANDGRTIRYAPDFGKLSLELQTGHVAHQTLHVALRHVARRDALARVEGGVDATLWNTVADAIVDACLAPLAWLALPDDAIALDDLLLRTMGIDAPVEASLLRWDCESLYRAIDDRGRQNATPGENGSDDGTGGDDDDGDGRGGGGSDAESESGRTTTAASSDASESADGVEVPSMVDGPRAAAARRLAQRVPPDLLDGDGEALGAEADAERTWSDRLARAHASDGAQSLLRTLVADLPARRTPWRQVLRTRLARSLAPEPELSWSRPSRSWLASRGRTSSGRRIPWQPGTVGARAAPRLTVIVDVSGSVHDVQLARFGAEVERLTRLHRAELRLVTGDERVHLDVRLVPGRAGLAAQVAGGASDGGGGTDFRPLLAAAAAHRPDLVIVLTDLEGPAGDAPGFPVVWATPAGSTAPLPYGVRLTLD